MIPSYISKWLMIIEQMNNDNTYKLAWGRAILECINLVKYSNENDQVFICFDDISELMLKYYWNQLFFFNLAQSPHKQKTPVICQITLNLIDRYKIFSKSSYPVWHNIGIETINKNDKELYKSTIKSISKILHYDVCYRFKNVNGSSLDIYEYQKKNGSLISLKYQDTVLLKEYSVVLSKLLNYKWTQLLEKYNYCPKIASKVKGISDSTLKRNSLARYRNLLLQEFTDNKIIDFYTEEELSLSQLSIDHVIPWSFMYSDDIWNLVITSKSNNSSKSNSVPSEEHIEKLKERNNRIINIINDIKIKNDMKLAIENSYVDRFYYDCRM